MAAKSILISLAFIFGSLGQEDKLNLPVDCVGDEVYPWFLGCTKYIQCSGNKADIKNCPKSNTEWDEKLKCVCAGSSANFVPSDKCGYSNCTDAITNIVGFTAANNNDNPFYGTCIKGSIIKQSKCRSNEQGVIPVFNETRTSCINSCTANDIVTKPGCTGYLECVDNRLIERTCPPDSLFNGKKCTFDDQFRCTVSSS